MGQSGGTKRVTWECFHCRVLQPEVLTCLSKLADTAGGGQSVTLDFMMRPKSRIVYSAPKSICSHLPSTREDGLFSHHSYTAADGAEEC